MGQPYIGEIRMFAGNFAPVGWEFCNGQIIPISENEALFTLIGTTYGGDGEETFALPDLQSRIPLHMGTGPDGITRSLAEMSGTEQETLTTQTIPVHTHPFVASQNTAQNSNPTGQVVGQSAAVFMYIEDAASSPLSPQAISPVGGSQPHENVQPFLCINYIISLFGIFPSQS
jgi:microcystin-dependent protein